MRRVGIAADHGGLWLKGELAGRIAEAGYEITDFGADSYAADDDYPDFVLPLARAVAQGSVQRGIAVCGSGVGACVAANKVRGVRACLVHDVYSARQGVEHDDMNMICLGGRVIGVELAWELTRAFLAATFSGAERHKRRLAKIAEQESQP